MILHVNTRQWASTWLVRPLRQSNYLQTEGVWLMATRSKGQMKEEKNLNTRRKPYLLSLVAYPLYMGRNEALHGMPGVPRIDYDGGEKSFQPKRLRKS